MKSLCIKVPEKFVEGLQELVRSGMYPSVSEAARDALRTFLERELERYGGQGRTRRQLTFA